MKRINIYPRASSITDCKYLLRINQIPIVSSDVVRGSPILVVEVINERRFQIVQNELSERKLIH